MSRVPALIVIALALAACSALTDFDGLSSGAAGAVTEDGGPSRPQLPSSDGGPTAPDGGVVETDRDASVASAIVADWPFDEGTGTTVRDVSGRGHDAKTQGGEWIADRNNAAGSAYRLIGGNDHLEVGPGADFNRPPNPKITIVAWARFDEEPSHAFVVNVNFGEEGYGLELRTRTKLTYWDGVEHSIETTVPDVVGAWHHYGLVIDGGEARLYLDGARVSSGRADDKPRTAQKLVFGLDPLDGVHLRGALDRVRFYTAALSDADILAEKNR